MRVNYRTPDGSGTVVCDRYERTIGEGINGPHVLTFFTGSGDDERVSGGVSRVIEFHEEAA
jgi:hypothetical protein